MTPQPDAARRTPLNRDRVLRAAVALADASGIDGLSMRSLAQELGVVPMALYKHVANKDELLDGIADIVVGEFAAPVGGTDWQADVRAQILAARGALLRHPWAARVIETRTQLTPGALAYLDALIGTFRAGGLSADLTHHAMHALGSRVWGFTQELLPAPPEVEGAQREAALREMAARYPHIAEIAAAAAHEDDTVVGGGGCDDQFEFEFALDVLLDGIARLHAAGWSSKTAG
ncbi:TetR/AcrR family transcriptional regulator C-terminal domain-containing protein [Yinghuangia seranimata]|uniref:TetR/AcrR family transcriptional regulator C-terminal domain-containing protein n=1 Tax=Yinghuangia seranimata TaxID=408067 RepID=UPI00248B648D|nr:TetR/AcrR family transcriptional regulator C-terminal domain-containing protein [Yinghuangia seranimata]MDI2130657.1 TetR/AcrR family transcriptional regulator C-terminal domain-containing protein [Yinghuangia seranimata]